MSDDSKSGLSQIKFMLIFLGGLIISMHLHAQKENKIQNKPLLSKELAKEIHYVYISKEQKVSIVGTVTDTRGKAISNAIISVNGIAYCVSDSLGSFKFGKMIALQSDSIDITIAALSFGTKRVRKIVESTNVLNIVLEDRSIDSPPPVDLSELLQGRMY